MPNNLNNKIFYVIFAIANEGIREPLSNIGNNRQGSDQIMLNEGGRVDKIRLIPKMLRR